MELREDKGSVKLRELDSGSSNVLNNSTDSSRAIEILHSCSTLLSFVCFLLPATLEFVSLFSSSPFCHTNFKTNPSTERLSLRLDHEHISKHKGIGRLTGKFHRESNGSKLSKRWLAQYLSQNAVDGVCGRSLFSKQDVFLSAVFRNNFSRLKQIP